MLFGMMENKKMENLKKHGMEQIFFLNLNLFLIMNQKEIVILNVLKDLFLMETAVEKKFMAPDKSNERVIATKVSGLKDPMIVYLVSQIQSTSFYDEIIHITNKNYINPISKGSLNKYYFQMEDTLYSGQKDTIYTISYRPNKNTNFDGLQGVLHISTNKWAIVNVKAKAAKDVKGIAVLLDMLVHEEN